ncbi:MAG TPA: hypothetical protein VFV99_26680, partial [Kofleriaceae bacterium]|nr:hypothetical protein [Kofleriaceae bacterium]
QSKALEEYEAEMRREEVEREAKTKEKLAKLDQLFGQKPAQMGTLLEGIRLGSGAGSFQPEDVRQRIENATRDGFMLVSFDADAKQLNAVEVSLYGDYETGDVCEKLDDKLTAAWGHPTNDAWLDTATHQRATLDKDDCKLRFDMYVEPADWVAQLPLAAVGSSAEKLSQQLGGSGSVESDDDRLYWNVPGLRFGKGDTKIEAYAVNGKIVGFKVTASSDFDSTLAVRDAISAKLKKQPKSEDSEYESSFHLYQWKTRVPVSLETSDSDRFTVMVGKMPWD